MQAPGVNDEYNTAKYNSPVANRVIQCLKRKPSIISTSVSRCLKAGCYGSNSVSQGHIVRRTSASQAALRDNPVSRAQFSQW
ncbi:hypothetical protein J6590_052003 [Homalodisca vitripennis]|nr:hypothetical protein J6590_052003 [Homalodisca vitripennis]